MEEIVVVVSSRNPMWLRKGGAYASAFFYEAVVKYPSVELLKRVNWEMKHHTASIEVNHSRCFAEKDELIRRLRDDNCQAEGASF